MRPTRPTPCWWRRGERYTVLFDVNAPGTWVFPCHILNHVEGPDGMFGMVTAVVAS